MVQAISENGSTRIFGNFSTTPTATSRRAHSSKSQPSLHLRRQLASVYRAAGHDADVRKILIAQRRAQLDRGVLTGRERLWARITGVTLGYDYQPWRALLFLLGVVITSVVPAVTLGTHGALVHPQDPKNPPAAT